MNKQTTFNILKSLSSTQSNSVLQRHGAQYFIAFRTCPLTSGQKRQLQSLKRKANPGYFDQVIGFYTDGYKLDCKPFEFRNGDYLYYFNFIGVTIVSIPVAMACALVFIFLSWYTLMDSQVTRMRSNPHPFLQIKNGLDMEKTKNPFFRRTVSYGPGNSDYKQLFYRELQKAKRGEL